MNIGSISSFTGAAAPHHNPFKQIKQDFQQLQAALKSGDLKAAQEAYAKLKQDLPAPKSSSSTSTSSQPKTDFDAIGTALQSGDLAGAQKAFATLQQDVQSARGARGHHHHHPDNDGDADDSSSTAPTAPNNALNIQA
jgi:hypothetical protein